MNRIPPRFCLLVLFLGLDRVFGVGRTLAPALRRQHDPPLVVALPSWLTRVVTADDAFPPLIHRARFQSPLSTQSFDAATDNPILLDADSESC